VAPVADTLMSELDRGRTELFVPEGRLVAAAIAQFVRSAAVGPPAVADALADPEIWPSRGVWLRVRSGHELRVLAEARADGVWVLWERTDPSSRGGRPRESQGSLGKSRLMTADDLQAFLSRWLALRVRG